MSAFEQLWISTRKFHRRFRAEPPALDVARRQFGEESVEVLIAGNRQDIMEEIAHVFVTSIGVLMSLNVSLEEFNAEMLQVAADNDAKTAFTHRLNLRTGKISSIQKEDYT